MDAEIRDAAQAKDAVVDLTKDIPGQVGGGKGADPLEKKGADPAETPASTLGADSDAPVRKTSAQKWAKVRVNAQVMGKLAVANKEIKAGKIEQMKLEREKRSSTMAILENAEQAKARQLEEGAAEATKEKGMKSKLFAFGVGFVAVAVVIVLCIWSKQGLLGEEHIGHSVIVKSRVGHMHSPMYQTPVTIALTGTMDQFFEVRLIAMATKDFSDFDSHRRLGSAPTPRDLAARQLGTAVTGSLTYKLVADGETFFEKTVSLCSKKELEDFTTVDVGDKGKSGAKEYQLEVTGTRSDGQEVTFMCQVLQMGFGGRHRELIGIVIFVITFIGIVTEKIHRSYCAFLGAGATLCAVSAIQETPHLHHIAGMIDWGTLMLLFSMMILMQMLAETGFFNWFALKVVAVSRQDVKVLWFLLTNISGFLSMVLDNVTCVLLFGPLVFNLAKKMNINPRPLYLAMTICATVGGTATQIGDPPNIVIGSKMKLGFEEFLFWNFPIVAVAFMPISSYVLWRRLKKDLFLDPAGAKKLDLEGLASENRITNMPTFEKLMAVLFGILVALLLSPVHKIEPAWFCVMGMFACAIMFERHRLDKYLDVVEWGTLLFFALLFVLVESLSELGVIRLLGEGVIALIEAFPEDIRMAMAIIIMLWVSSIGSAFLESLPFTTTIVYVLIDLQTKSIAGVRTNILVWPLSMGACVGGIGSIMGSSANLVCMAVSSRFGDTPESKVQGSDFLKHGLPTLLIITTVGMAWQLILFVGIEAGPDEATVVC